MLRTSLTKSIVSGLAAISLVLGISISASAVAAVPGFKVVTTTTTAKLTWSKYASGKVTSIKVDALTGTTKKTKTLAATTASYSFTSLTHNRSYKFTITAFKGSKIVASSSITTRTKKILMYNSIFFGTPKDMTLGDDNQLLFALPNGGEMSFTTSTPTVCEIVDTNFVKALTIGTCTVVASNPGDSDYAPAADETRSFSISAPLSALNPTLLWSDEFDESTLNETDWSVTLGDGCGTAAGCGWGNQESQSYAACAIAPSGGVMYINATTSTGNPNCTSNKNWTSGKFISKGKRDFTYGYFEAKMKMPSGGGAWPAFWLLGSNIDTVPWPGSGEIDIMEYTGNVPTRSTSAVHYANVSGVHAYKSGSANSALEYSLDYHTYGLLWLPTELTFYVDGKQSLKVTKSDTGLTRWPFGPDSKGVDPKMYLIFNMAMGGNYGGSIERGLTSAQVAIDYVRYYSVSGLGKTN